MITEEIDFTPEQIARIMQNLHKLTPEEQADTLELVEEITDRRSAKVAQTSLLEFAMRMGPVLQMETEPKVFMPGQHHRRLTALMDAVARGEKKRILISIAPRMGKSLLSSYLFPAWYMGQFPNRRVIMASNTGDMATGFGRKVRDLIDTEEYRQVFPDVELKSDSKSAGQWATNKGGEYFACGIGAALAGRGANLVCIDDPFSERDIISGNTQVFDDAWTWFQSGPVQRLAPDGAIVVIHTRWAKGDLIGRIIAQMTNDPDVPQWDVVEFPAILNEGEENQKSLWPERWPLEALLEKKAVLDKYLWNAQYMQNPTGQAGAIIKASYWNDWDKEDPPDCEYIIMGLDAAQEAHNRADFNAWQVWGVFYRDTGRGEPVANIILLDAWQKRMEYPELKKAMMEAYTRWSPDNFIIEKKSSGSVLYQEFRHAGIPVSEFTPSKGNDKTARMNSVAEIFSSGLVWAPKDRKWAREVIDQCNDFPNGDNDDACFVAGTKITMADGSSKPIEEVAIGDKVFTPFGSQEVLDAGSTGVRTVYTCSGLVGTGNHPIATSKGWMPLLHLNHGCTIITASTTAEYASWPERILKSTRKTWCSTVSHITDTLTVATQRIVDTSCGPGAGNFCIEQCGRSRMATSRQGFMCTTSTETQATTTYQISSVSRKQITAQSISKQRRPEEKNPNSLSISQESDSRQLHGIAARKGLHGTKITPRKLALGSIRHMFEKIAVTRVWSVARPLCQRVRSRLYALQNALKRNLPNRTNQRLSGHVLYAASDLFPDIPPGVSRCAHKHVKTSTGIRSEKPSALLEKQRVYNLTVGGYPCYVANGILVHNCDTMTLCLRRFRTGGFIRLNTDEADEETYGAQRKRSYY